nr:TPA_asm: m87.4 sORF 3 [Murid betaherpesvirus 1]DBA08028.1 TPA_asm: m87.4 sORF 3 [Murid betaherpesvirus 1]
MTYRSERKALQAQKTSVRRTFHSESESSPRNTCVV